MEVFCITFSDRWRRETHPLDPDVDPDGWIEVRAIDKEEALQKAYRSFNAYFSDVVPKQEFITEHYPLGCLYSVS